MTTTDSLLAGRCILCRRLESDGHSTCCSLRDRPETPYPSADTSDTLKTRHIASGEATACITTWAAELAQRQHRRVASGPEVYERRHGRLQVRR